MKKLLVLTLAFSLSFGSLVLPVYATEVEDTEEVIDLATTEEDVANIDDDELLEAEPSELPDVEEDEGFTKKMYGKMLLDVEGNGEVYYVDPVTGGKEYLADGTSAHKLLERRALGISEENFAKLIQGDAKEDSSVCDEADLGKRLRGRIVIRTEENGEAYWIYPDNCRAYYAGTFDAAYQLMKNYSLGIKKADLARVRNNERQRVKTAFRYAVYAYAEDNDIDLAGAREELKEEIEGMRTCMKDAGFSKDSDKTKEERIEQIKLCAEETEMPIIDKERRQEIRETIQEVRAEKREDRREKLRMKIKNFAEKIKERMKNRREGGGEEEQL